MSPSFISPVQRAGAAVCVLRFRAGRFVIESILHEADKAHHELIFPANEEAHPELYRDGAGPDVMTAADWQAKYPLLSEVFPARTSPANVT